MSIESILKSLGSHFLNLTERSFVFGPQGKLLMRNIEEQWFLHCVTMPLYNVFLTSSEKVTCTLNELRNNSLYNVPFGLAIVEESKSSWNQSILPANFKTAHRIAKINIISDDSDSTDLFYKKQRERKVWWRKLAQNPSRFMFSELKKGKNCDTLELQAQFEFGNIVVETLSHYHNPPKAFLQDESSKNTENVKCIVEHVVSLDWGCLTLLCDSYKPDPSEIQIHPKLSPYKAAFYMNGSLDETDTETEDLHRLVLYLSSLVRKEGLHTIVINTKKVAETCLVPFIVTVDKTSLKNGIIYVTNRSTTLAETIHITDLVKHIASRCS